MDNIPEEIENDSYMQAERTYQENQKKTKEKSNIEKHSSDKNVKGFIAGTVVIIFAITGLVFSVVFAVRFFSETSEKKKTAVSRQYEQMLIPVAAIDPAGFDDVASAPMKELVHIALWSIIGDDMDPGAYSYDDDELIIPVEDVEKAFAEYFGTQISAEHMSVEGYGYEFKYDAEKNAYIVPLTTITPIYTPRVTSVETKGGTVIITCGLINSNIWMQDHETGVIFSPEPDKYIKIMMREFNGVRYIGSIQSSGTPEIAVPNSNVPQTTVEQTETTEEETIVITRN